ncbi:beta-adrenergic receptor kinase 1-like isoform X2 [Corticium candelabrum]|nr:beta-adrenergic receptor kinase 1-like isoform X2 [Corticium candelabrum]
MADKDERSVLAKTLFDSYIMPDLLIRNQLYSSEAEKSVKEPLLKNDIPPTLFSLYKCELEKHLYAGNNKFDEFLVSSQYVRFCQWKNIELNQSPSLDDFVIHRIIGRGGFGEVYGCHKMDSGKMYAIKCLNKKWLKYRKGEAGALNERNILARVNNPFVVCMTYAFQTTEKLCLVLDLMNGGDLSYHLMYYRRFSEDWVKFYAREIILGLEHLHNLQIVYRDLKPANCLLSEDGHLKISDLGLACDISSSKPSERVGTLGYMAPEVIQKDVEYDCRADWFSFGCMLFKMLTGHSPFGSRDRAKIDQQVETMDVEIPDGWSDEVVMLVLSLLQKDPDYRLGLQGAGSVKQHPFFTGTNWDDVFALKYPPPFIPPRGEVNAIDVVHIGVFVNDEVKGIRLSDQDQDNYRSFNVVMSAHWQREMIDTTLFALVNQEADRAEAKKLTKMKRSSPDQSLIYDVKAAMRQTNDCILQGYMRKRGTQFSVMVWNRRYYRLYPNRLEWSEDQHLPVSNLITMESVQAVEEMCVKRIKCVRLVMKGEMGEHVLRPNSQIEYEVWLKQLGLAFANVADMIKCGPKAFQCSYMEAKKNGRRVFSTWPRRRLSKVLSIRAQRAGTAV